MARSLPLALLLAGCSVQPAQPPDATSPAPYDALQSGVSAFARRQIEDKAIPGAAIALTVRDAQGHLELQWAAGFGWQDPACDVPAAADTVWRVGSISKLVTATLIMQLVEAGTLDLDRPVGDYLPEFRPRPRPEASGDETVTLRHLLSHRAGLVREPAVGHYFDPDEPTLAATVASLNSSALVYAPGARFKYSNAGYGVLGRVLERVTGRPFAELARERVLAPLGMTDSSFVPRAEPDDRAAAGVMWTFDGRAIPTPTFALGYGSAGELRSTVVDLVRFAEGWFPSAITRVSSRESLQAMWQIQFAPDGGGTGCGLGFFVDRSEDRLRVGHGGAVYGFAAELRAFPEEGIAVAVAVNLDSGNAVARAIAERAVQWARAAREGSRPELQSPPRGLGADSARALAGSFGDGDTWVELKERDGDLVASPCPGGDVRLWQGDAGMVTDGRTSMGETPLRMAADGAALYWQGRRLPRLSDDPPPPAPPEYGDLIGEYGWDHDVLVVYEDRGRLCVLVEWLDREPLRREAQDRYRFADRGMYPGEAVEFERGADGAVTAVRIAEVRFVRRSLGPEAGATFRIEPQHPVAALRAMAAAATPPPQPPGLREPDLVELRELDGSIRYDIRYAGTDNFMGTPFYEVPRAMLQRPAAEALVRVHRALGERGYGLVVHDAYRPWAVTKMFWDATPAELRHFVANPERGSRHNRACAVDLTLYRRETGTAVEMPSGYDEFTARAYADYPGGTARQRWHRELLRRAMEAQGFSVYEFEWWHFDDRDWREYPVLNEPFR